MKDALMQIIREFCNREDTLIQIDCHSKNLYFSNRKVPGFYKPFLCSHIRNLEGTYGTLNNIFSLSFLWFAHLMSVHERNYSLAHLIRRCIKIAYFLKYDLLFIVILKSVVWYNYELLSFFVQNMVMGLLNVFSYNLQ